MKIALTKIRRDGGTQPRAGLNQERIEHYAEAYGAGIHMPSVLVMHDGTDYWLYDGFHRCAGAELAGLSGVDAGITQGTREDAVWASLAANRDHDTAGLYRSNEDKKRAVLRALEMRPKMADNAIAKHVGVDHKTVAKYRGTLGNSQPDKRIGADGRAYPAPPPPPPPLKSSSPRVEPFPDSSNAPDVAAEAEPNAPKKVFKQTGTTEGDVIGRGIPERCLDIWARRHEPQELLSAISRVRAIVREAQEQEDQLYGEVNFSFVLSHLDQAYTGLTVARPYAVCPYCHGDGCKVCCNRGMVSKYRWDKACAEEFKEAALAEAGAGN